MLNALDIVFLAIAGFFAVKGLLRGFLRELASLAGLYIGFRLATLYSPQAVPYLKPFLQNDAYLGAAAWVVVFVGSLILVWLAVRVLTMLLKITMLSGFNHAAGGLFGLVKGTLLCAILLMLLNVVLPQADFTAQSRLAPLLRPVAEYLAEFLPDNLQDMARLGGQELKRRVHEETKHKM